MLSDLSGSWAISTTTLEWSCIRSNHHFRSNDHYPFGLTFNSFTRNYSEPQKYKYNGNEQQLSWGVGVSDFNARTYDGTIGRFYQVDPLAEVETSWTPYRFGFNNPIRYNDMSGLLETDGQDNFHYSDPDEIASVLAGLKRLEGNPYDDSTNNSPDVGN